MYLVKITYEDNAYLFADQEVREAIFNHFDAFLLEEGIDKDECYDIYIVSECPDTLFRIWEVMFELKKRKLVKAAHVYEMSYKPGKQVLRI